MTAAAGHNREIEQLKTLLFQPETARLETLETDVAFLQQYVGGPNRLEAATADILIAALERAEVDRPRELANVIAPSVVSAIRSEIQNSRELMVDALYPITGRLVSAAVANAFRELIAALEQRINALTSAELWIGRVKSLVTGRPISEFVLANGNPPSVNRLLILERGSGRLIADWKRDGTPDERADLLSAMVAAILEFSVQALAGEGNLQKLDFGGREIVLRASPRFILAAECKGSLRPADDSRINSLFFDTIESMDRGSSIGGAMLASLAASIEGDPDARKKTTRRGRIVLFALLALAAAALVWLAGISISRATLERRAHASIEQFVEREPLLASFPLRLDFDHSNRRVSVRGIEPSEVDVGSLLDELAQAAAPYRIVNRIGIVPGMGQSAFRTDVAVMQQSVASLQSSVEEARAAIAEESRSRDRQYTALEEQHSALEGQYAELRRLADSPAERLNRFMASTAIFFGDEAAFLEEEEAEQDIRRLATLLTDNDLRIRIVGYADDTGTEAGNRVIAGKRAEQVMRRLTSLGIDPSRLFVVSRSASMPISDKTGATIRGNRRVAFENVFGAERPL